LVGQWLSEHLGQQFVVENRPGGAGNIGTEAVVRALADGYTLLMIDVSPAINATLFKQSAPTRQGTTARPAPMSGVNPTCHSSPRKRGPRLLSAGR
jgi:Tripartite tricarboxylate transporter family receptor